MFARWGLGAVVGLVGMGCARPQSASSGHDAPAAKGTSASAHETTGPVAPLRIAASPEQAGKLGSRCTEAATCGTQNRIAVRAYQQMRFAGVETVPCELTSVASMSQSQPGTIPPQEVAACVAGGVLYAESRCVMCRLPQVTSLEAVIAELTEQQVREVRKLTRLEGEKSLRDADDWQRAIADAHRERQSAPGTNPTN